MPLSNGSKFAGFTIIRLLGAGGMGEVYLATHPRLPRRNALKILPASVSSDDEFRERFNREADLASTLYHPHIVGVHDRGEFDGQLWISMDFVDGADAGNVLADSHPDGMPPSNVAAIVTAVASALDYAHKEGLLHRDVKPANIMLTHADTETEQRILLTDFGIARNLNEISGLTATNTTVGTVAYTAPEQLMGDDLDGRADQYALAATAYHLLTGSPLFPHTNPAVVISRHLNAAPSALGEVRSELAILDPVMAIALAKDPSDRFPRCADFARAFAEHAQHFNAVSPTAPTALAPVAIGSPKPAPEPNSPRPVPEAARIGRQWLIPVVMLAVILLIGAIAVAWQPWQRKQSASSTTSPVVPQFSRPIIASPPPAPPPPPPPVFPTSAIDTLLLGAGEINDTVGAGTLEVSDSSFGMSDNTVDVTPAACVGLIYGAEQRVYGDTGFVEMRDQTLSPRPYTEAEAYATGPWRVQQTVVAFPAAEQARSLLTSSENRWRSCAAEQVMQKGYEFTTPWELSNIQLRADVLTVSMADLSVTGPAGGACQHALGMRANVVAEAISCTAETTVAGNGAERIVFAILDRVRT